MKGYKLLDTSVILSIIYQAKFPEIFKIITEQGYNILIPKEVYREIKEDLRIIAELLKEGKIDLLPETDCEKVEIMKNKHPSFGNGEISVLVCGIEKTKNGEKCRCMIDDRDAKIFAKNKGLKVNGVIGLLLWLKDLQKINKEDCIKIYERLKQNPRLPDDLLKELIK